MKDEEKNTCSEQCVEENQEHCQCDCQCEADCMANEEQSINISEIESELDKALASASENRDLYLRAVADLDTYRRKVQREKQELSKFALQPLIEELLPSIDHLDMAIQACTTPECANIKIGVEMVSTQIKKVLSNFGVEEVVVLGKAFDPNTSECGTSPPEPLR